MKCNLSQIAAKYIYYEAFTDKYMYKNQRLGTGIQRISPNSAMYMKF